ncbi:MAG: glycosyltransferase family 4 protein [Desulfarculus sp.]|nr:glycosyltransferase family 4 protein [Desulfarculus sp.]
MRILGFVNSFDELADPDRRLGRKVANYGAVAALLEYSSFDELHFFLPFQAALRPFEQGYAPWLTRPENARRVKLLSAQALPAALEQVAYTALHAAELERYFPELCHLRNRFARRPLPITCVPHSLSYWATQVRNLYKVLPGPQPFDSILCTSRAARDYLQKALGAAAAQLQALGLEQAGYPGRLDLVPLGVRLADFPPEDQAQAQAKLGLPPGVLTLLCLGRLTPYDKYDLTPLLGVLHLLNQRRPVRLLLAGAEDRLYGQALMETARGLGLAQRVHLFKNFDTSLKPTLLAAADIFVSPSDNLQETFGLAIIEAMAAGLPVVASDFSGYRDLVADGKTGFLVPTLGPSHYGPLDPLWPLLADHIAALLTSQRLAVDLGILHQRLEMLASDGELRRRLGQAGRRRAEQRFDWAVVVPRLERLWLELARQAQRAGPLPALPNVLGAGLAQVFGGFPSQTLAAGEVLAAGPLAGQYLAGAWASKPYPDLAPSLDPAQVGLLLQALADLGGQAGLESLQTALAGRLPASQVEHLALWALKYGILRRPAAAAT